MTCGVSGVQRSLRPLPRHLTWWAAPEVHVGAGEAGELGDPQPGLEGESEQGVIAAAHPTGPVRGGQQRPGLLGS